MARAGAVAGVVSGLPSTAWALLHADDPLAPTRAAGRMALPRAQGDPALLAAAAVVHGVLSLGWTAVIARTVPAGRGRLTAAAYGAVAGAAIAAIDLGTAHRSTNSRFTAVRALAVAPQVADHLVFGAVAAVTLRSATAGR